MTCSCRSAIVGLLSREPDARSRGHARTSRAASRVDAALPHRRGTSQQMTPPEAHNMTTHPPARSRAGQINCAIWENEIQPNRTTKTALKASASRRCKGRGGNWKSSQPSTSASTAWASSCRAPRRRISVRASCGDSGGHSTRPMLFSRAVAYSFLQQDTGRRYTRPRVRRLSFRAIHSFRLYL